MIRQPWLAMNRNAVVLRNHTGEIVSIIKHLIVHMNTVFFRIHTGGRFLFYKNSFSCMGWEKQHIYSFAIFVIMPRLLPYVAWP